MKGTSCDLCGSDDERYSDASSLDAHLIESLRTSAQRSGLRGPPPATRDLSGGPDSLSGRSSPLTRPIGRRPDVTDLASVDEQDLWLTPRLRRVRAPSPAKRP